MYSFAQWNVQKLQWSSNIYNPVNGIFGHGAGDGRKVTLNEILHFFPAKMQQKTDFPIKGVAEN